MKRVSVILLVILAAFLSANIFGSDLTLSAAIAAGETDGKKDASVILGFTAGLALNIIGVGISYTLPVNLKEERQLWINVQTNDQAVRTAYIEAYKRAYRRALVNSAWLGCGTSIVAYTLFIVIIIRAITSWG